MPNPNHLTKVQRGIISNVLQTRYAESERQAALRMGVSTQADLAMERMQSEPHEAQVNDGDQEVEAALSDMQSDAFNELSAAMDRIHGPTYGACADCKMPIAFERLRAVPEALRCLACETIFEAKQV
jgi:DnaK suppressor protein